MADKTPEPVQGISARSRYEALATVRSPYLQRARSGASLTIPWVMPRDDYRNGAELPTPFQSVGARGVNHLTSSIMLALFPPNETFFQYEVEPYLLDKVGDKIREEVESNLRKAEEAMLMEMEATGFRPRAHESLLHLVVAGNCVLYWPEDAEQMRTYHLDNYVVERDGTGRMISLVLRDCLGYNSLDKKTAAIVNRWGYQDSTTQVALATGQPAPIEVFTEVLYDRERDLYTVRQEVVGVTIPGSTGTYQPDDLPFIVLRGNVISGEHYGRSHVEGYLGDLISLEGLAQAIVEYAAAAARILFLVDPAGQTDIEEITGKPNGAYVPGRKQDIMAAGIEKFADMQITAKTADTIEQRLALAFLLNTSVQRQAERVTATEIRWVAQELERGLGGMYSLLSQEFQLPVVKLMERRMRKQGKLPPIPKDLVNPTIVAGIEAIGRGTDADKLETAFRGLSEILTPQVLAGWIVPDQYILRTLNSYGIRNDGLIQDPEVIKQQQQAQMMQQMIQKLGPQAINQFGQSQRQGVDYAQAQQPPQQAA